MSFAVLTIILAATWAVTATAALLYQLNYYVRTRATSRPLLAVANAELARISVELKRADDNEADELLREKRANEGGRASIQVSNAKVSTLVWVHVFLTGVGITALVVAIMPITPTTTSAGITLASVGSLALAARLVWLTWYSNGQYRKMRMVVAEDRVEGLQVRVEAIQHIIQGKRVKP